MQIPTYASKIDIVPALLGTFDCFINLDDLPAEVVLSPLDSEFKYTILLARFFILWGHCPINRDKYIKNKNELVENIRYVLEMDSSEIEEEDSCNDQYRFYAKFLSIKINNTVRPTEIVQKPPTVNAETFEPRINLYMFNIEIPESILLELNAELVALSCMDYLEVRKLPISELGMRGSTDMSIVYRAIRKIKSDATKQFIKNHIEKVLETLWFYRYPTLTDAQRNIILNDYATVQPLIQQELSKRGLRNNPNTTARMLFHFQMINPPIKYEPRMFKPISAKQLQVLNSIYPSRIRLVSGTKFEDIE
jgi:hypothetical protein